MLDIDPQLIRVLNVILAFIALVIFNANMVRRRDHIPRRMRRVALYLFGSLVIFAYGSGAAYSASVPLFASAYMLTANLLGLIVALLWHPEGDEQLPPHDGSLGQWLLDAWKQFIGKE